MKFLTLAILHCFFSYNKAAGIPEFSKEECVDKVEWCGTTKQYCIDHPVIVPYCRKSCGECSDDDDKNPGKVPQPSGPDCSTLLCQHSCLNTPEGGVCQCKEGYKLQEDNKSCQDINECESANSCGEGQTCVNTEGSYRCEQVCTPGEKSYYGRKGCCKITKGQCGKNTLSRDIFVKEKDSLVSRWPWMSFISTSSNDKTCGGILVDKSWVLTAAHCFEQPKTDDVSVYFGVKSTNNVGDIKGYLQERKAEKIVVHPKYNYPSYDVALVKLSQEVDITEYVSTVCLPSNEYPPVGEKCFATGYTSIPNRGVVTRTLQQERVAITDRKSCADEMIKLDETTMCVSHENRTTAHDCQGSTGGPLVCQRCSSCDWYVAGLASKGIPCSKDKTVSLFTSVSVQEDWIRTTIGLAQLRARVGAPCQLPGKGTKNVIEWSNWGSWSECSVSCGRGLSRRERVCNNGISGEDGCAGDDKETVECLLNPCGGWSDWEEWSSCSITCGGGSRSRNRKCISTGRRGCIGVSRLSEQCNTQPCPRWTRWDKWSPCSVSCGTGKQTSQRMCKDGKIGDKGCRGKNTKTKNCKRRTCPKWNNWSRWSSCSTTCGDGVQKSTRKCMLGKRQKQGCDGLPTRTKPCNLAECRGCTEWSEWSQCSSSCGSAVRERSRECPSTDPTTSTKETKPCKILPCPGKWSDWAEWSECSASCDGGQMTRRRICLEGDCIGPDMIHNPCNTMKCPDWSTWAPWGECNAKCGTGMRQRTRECLRDRCRGRPFEEEECFVKECPKKEICGEVRDTWIGCPSSVILCSMRPHQMWGVCDKTCCLEEYRMAFTSWSSWSRCSKTCDTGTQTRWRECKLPHSCAKFNEPLQESRQCQQDKCPERILKLCSATCGGGLTHRRCEGEECDGVNEYIIEPCNTEPCPDETNPWGEWGPCSKTCGVGTRLRMRLCYGTHESCGYDNAPEIEECKESECGEVWSQWQPWGKCSVSCGLGTIRRKRTCLEGDCSGPNTEENICVTFDCPEVLEPLTCEDDQSMQYLCPFLVPQYCSNDYVKFACRKTCQKC